MNLRNITPVILTFNERENLARTLAPLTAFPRIVVLDSGSTDETRAIAHSHANVVWHERPFDTHAAQWNHALALADTEWILSLDADYVVTAELLHEVASLPETSQFTYLIPFRFCVHGQPLRASLLPARPALFRRTRAQYVQEGHTQVLAYQDPLQPLQHALLHDDRKPLTRWFAAQSRYVQLEVDKLLQKDTTRQDLADRLRRLLVVMPILTPVYVLLWKGLILDGWRGWHYAASRTLVELMYSLELIDRRLRLR